MICGGCWNEKDYCWCNLLPLKSRVGFNARGGNEQETHKTLRDPMNTFRMGNLCTFFPGVC